MAGVNDAVGKHLFPDMNLWTDALLNHDDRMDRVGKALQSSLTRE